MSTGSHVRTAAARAARIDAFIANDGVRPRQRKLRFSWVCPVCDLTRYLEPQDARMCRICACEFRAVMQSRAVRAVLGQPLEEDKS
ncbi:MAG: hypothetical protein ACP5P4_15115 [Steroidobacteraceae bacterium]